MFPRASLRVAALVLSISLAALVPGPAAAEVRTTVGGKEIVLGKRATPPFRRTTTGPAADAPREVAVDPAAQPLEASPPAEAPPLAAGQPKSPTPLVDGEVRPASSQEEIYLEGPIVMEGDVVEPDYVIEEHFSDGYVTSPHGHGPHGPACDGWTCTTNVCRCRFARLEFLSWWGAGRDLPVLVSEDFLPSEVLFGGDLLEEDGRTGGRLLVGKWLDGGQTIGVMARYYSLDDGDFRYDLESEGGIRIARPFFNLENSAGQIVGPDALQVAGDGVAGSISVVGGQRFHGGDLLIRKLVRATRTGSVDFLFGYTAARLEEDLVISSTSNFDNVDIGVTDMFDTKNEFHGVSFGMISRHDGRRFGLELLGKIALGDMRQQAVLDGSATNSDFGLLIQAANEGAFEDNAFVLAPEFGANLVFHARPNLDLLLGYSVLYWSSVARPQSLIPQNLMVNPNNPPGPDEIPQQPFRFIHEDYWLQGLNFGVAFSF